jgi:hypothetical protein
MMKLNELRGKVKLRRLTKTDVAYLHFKLALGVMLYLPLLQSPSLQAQTSGVFLSIWAAVTGAGLLVSLCGLVLGAQEGEPRRAGIAIELAGLTLLMAGPSVFMAVQIGLLLTGGRSSGLAVMFPYVICAALVCRMVMVKDSAKPVVYRIKGLDTDGD